MEDGDDLVSLGGKRKRDEWFVGKTLRSITSVEVDQLVGAGTYGIVYRAKGRVDGVKIALKKIKFETDIEKYGFPVTVSF